MIVYDAFWETMKSKGLTQYALIKHYGVSPAQITRLKRNKGVSTNTIDRFCHILHCSISDVMSYKEECDNGFKKSCG